MAEENRCPQCGDKLGANAPRGVCPKCLIKVGLPSGADIDKTATPDEKNGVPTSATPPGGFVPPEPAELAEKFPQLEIIELLGQGGMGAVYKARQKQLERLVALKILPPEVGRDPAFAERFAREARSMAKLNHQYVVTLYEFGHTEDGLYYFLMEFVDGTDLRHLIQTGELGTDEALAIVPQVCEALQYAHEEGIVHRDIKPENILLDKKGRVKIADFGLARLLDRPATAFTLTQAGQRMGTPHYMAPEQIQGGHEVDHRADIYSLGVVFYEMLTGQLPIGQFAPPSQKVHVDVRLDKVVLKSLAHEPERRYQHASEVKTEVETITHVAPPPKSAPADVELPAPKTSRLAIASLVLAILSPFTCYITAIPAIIMGIVVLVKIPQSRGQLKGTGLAISAIALPVVLVVLVPVVAGTGQNQTNRLPSGLRSKHARPRQGYAYLYQQLR
ncbi:MAG: protein kinase domain-containing protein [Planctomycetota bacterium]|jgi:serine/threonine protein kinase